MCEPPPNQELVNTILREREVSMRLRLFATAVLVVALAIAAASATGASQASPAKAQADALTVWLMGDAQANWPEAVAAATQTFKSQHPGVDVNVQYQSWGDYKTKFEATLSAGSGPDVIEFGNTDVPKYSAAGALSPLNRADFPNSGTWLSGLTKAGSYNGKLFAVPYYAGARGVIYRTDQYKAAGITKTPKTLAEFNAANAKLIAKFGGSKNPNYSAVYFPGRYWYAAMSFVYDYGGQIAKTQGRQVGRHAARAEGALRPDRVAQRRQELLAGEQDRRRGASAAGARLREGQRRLVRRQRLGVAVRARPEGRQPGARGQDRRLPDAEPHAGQVHADVPRRLEPRRPGHEQAEGARRRLDRRVHEHAEHDADGQRAAA